jgi:hypothetical protein
MEQISAGQAPPAIKTIVAMGNIPVKVIFVINCDVVKQINSRNLAIVIECLTFSQFGTQQDLNRVRNLGQT